MSTFGEGDFGTGFFGGEAVVYVAIGTLDAWNALSPAEQAFYGGGHYLDLGLGFAAHPGASAADDYYYWFISSISTTGTASSPSDCNGYNIVVNGKGFSINDSGTSSIIAINSDCVKIENLIITPLNNRINDTIPAIGLANFSEFGTTLENVTFNRNGTNTIFFRERMAAGYECYINRCKYIGGAEPSGGGWFVWSWVSNGINNVTNCTVIDATTTFNGGSTIRVKNVYSNAYGNDFTSGNVDLGGNTSSDLTAPEVARQNRAPIDSFEDLVDYIPKDVAWMEGVEITEFDTYLNGVTTVDNYWAGANGRAVATGGAGLGGFGWFFDDAFIWG